ncbi:MAG: hypothetical protein DRJ49_04400 [Thermoprotei archaeon]|nr:MAG: hypothetical protein DRJ49_04400 [Thermoprotei archaeon]
MKVFCTGISGSGRIDYLKEVLDLALRRGKKVNIINVGDMMFDTAKELGRVVREDKILDLSPSTLEWLRAVVFEKILKLVEREEHKDHLISSHTTFRWKRYLVPAFDFFYLNQLSPDIYVTIIDGVSQIKVRLEQHPQWAGKLSIREILIWQDEEVFVTKMLADYQRRPYFIVARAEPAELLYKIMYTNVKRAYLSFPITHVRGEEGYIEEVKKFRDELRKFLIVFDPMAINDMDLLQMAEIAKNEGRDYVKVHHEDVVMEISITEILEAAEEIKFHTVKRDYMLIDQSDIIVVYYPIAAMSPGVLSEMIYAHTNNKHVYVVFEETSGLSPFFEYYATKVFNNPDDLFSELSGKK